jgi:hypothetical protein
MSLQDTVQEGCRTTKAWHRWQPEEISAELPADAELVTVTLWLYSAIPSVHATTMRKVQSWPFAHVGHFHLLEDSRDQRPRSKRSAYAVRALEEIA